MGFDEKYNKIISRRFSNNKITLQTDFVAIESPLEVSLSLPSGEKEDLAILMRTPGDDEKLIYGFLLGEGILNIDQLKKSEYNYSENKINLMLNETQLPDLSEMKRNFISNSSCGICGKETISEIIKKIPSVNNSIENYIDGLIVQKICSQMREKQELFSKTGGGHAVGLFTNSGKILCIEEDVGRHNAMDKAIGKSFVIDSNGKEIVGACLSGRASYEMVQKAAMSGIEIVICIGAPTSLAIDLAVACSITLVGFISEKGYNIYTCENRILSTVN